MEIFDLNDLALKKVKITGNVIGKFGTFEIEQEYYNNTNKVLEVGYTFPIVDTATVIGFEIKVGDKEFKGICKEKGEAKKEYQENLVKGNSAYLMEQETKNTFRISIGKIDKDEMVKVKIKYIDKFEIVDNVIKVLIPTLVTPKYKSKITNFLLYGKVDYSIDFNIFIDKCINRKSINSISHPIKIVDEGNKEKIVIENYDLSKDFKMDIELKQELNSNAIKYTTRDNKDLIYLSFMPEIENIYEDNEKDYIFIIDISGSMSGTKIEETINAVKECLRSLDEGDKFNIVPFNNIFSAMSINSLEVNEENIEKAIKYVESLKASGGTEILEPVKFALYEKDVEKVILLFTDGQVGNENFIIDFVKDNIKKSRLFPFGIDNNINASFIKELARVGHGKAEFIMPGEKIDDKIIRTFSRIQTPMVDDLKIVYGNSKVEDEIKEEDVLFNYEFFNAIVKLDKLEDDIKLVGKIKNQDYSVIINKDDIKETSVDLEVLYAKEQIIRLEKYISNSRTRLVDRDNYIKMIIDLAVKYNINSQYTSFITVYERDNKIFDVPDYQETILSDRFMENQLRNSSIPMGRGMAKMATASSKAQFIPKMTESSIPYEYGTIVDMEIENNDFNRLHIIINNYCKELLDNNNMNLKTYLLYILYCIRNFITFDLNKFFEFVIMNKDELNENKIYIDLLYLICKSINKNEVKKEIIDLLSDDYKKSIITGLNIDIKIELPKLSKEDRDRILETGDISLKIDEALWTENNM